MKYHLRSNFKEMNNFPLEWYDIHNYELELAFIQFKHECLDTDLLLNLFLPSKHFSSVLRDNVSIFLFLNLCNKTADRKKSEYCGDITKNSFGKEIKFGSFAVPNEKSSKKKRICFKKPGSDYNKNSYLTENIKTGEIFFQNSGPKKVYEKKENCSVTKKHFDHKRRV